MSAGSYDAHGFAENGESSLALRSEKSHSAFSFPLLVRVTDVFAGESVCYTRAVSFSIDAYIFIRGAHVRLAA
jgi:hypothetical protein